MPFTATVLTMFPEAFPGPLGVSLIGTSWTGAGPVASGNTGHSGVFQG
jgi:hypothetical protein